MFSVSPRAVVFDLDGLMFNTEELYQHAGTEILRRRGHKFSPELLNAMMGRPQKDSLQLMIDAHFLDDTIAQLAMETEQIISKLLDVELSPMPGVVQLMEALEAAQIPKAIATSSGLRFTRNVLSRFDWESRFQFVLTSEDIAHGKPHPEIYLTAAQRFGMQPGEVMVLEDSQNGCRSAVAAGAVVVAVPVGHGSAHDFSGAAFVADTLADPRIYARLGLPQPS
jgi:HAD superfamily hydrolase (TIGR01509 family)